MKDRDFNHMSLLLQSISSFPFFMFLINLEKYLTVICSSLRLLLSIAGNNNYTSLLSSHKCIKPHLFLFFKNRLLDASHPFFLFSIDHSLSLPFFYFVFVYNLIPRACLKILITTKKVMVMVAL